MARFSGLLLMFITRTLDLRSKGPGKKGNPPIREMISSSIYFLNGILIHGKTEPDSMNSLGKSFHCILDLHLQVLPLYQIFSA